MRLPGEAWLEFHLAEHGDQFRLHQTATFRPKGLWGRLYWYILWPFHLVIFKRMIQNITRYHSADDE
jgi:hypothetical protein